MEWLDGDKVMAGVTTLDTEVEGEVFATGASASLADRAEQKAAKAASLKLIDLGIRCTLSQLIETGVMHADPHGGNLLRLKDTGQGLVPCLLTSD
jgi:hypothetical protein